MTEVKRATLGRLPLYLNYLKSVSRETENVSATEIARALELGEVQVRKDLSSVSGNGKPKIGYAVDELKRNIEKVIGNEMKVGTVLVGAGKLGKAILDYDGFAKFNAKIDAAFDCDEKKIGKSENGKDIKDIRDLKKYCLLNQVKIGIITVPPQNAAAVCDMLVDSGVKAIWNFAPVKLKVPEGVVVRQEDMALSLAYLNLLFNEGKQTGGQ